MIAMIIMISDDDYNDKLMVFTNKTFNKYLEVNVNCEFVFLLLFKVKFKYIV